MKIQTQRRLRAGGPTLSGILVALVLALAACGTSSAPPPSSAKLLSDASTRFSGDTSLHFTYNADNIGFGPVAVVQAAGDVVRPDKIKLSGLDEPTKGFTAGVGIVIIGQDQYLDLGGFGNWTKTSALPPLQLIFDPTQGITAILTKLQNPSTATSDTVKIDATHSVACWKITGTADSSLLAPLTGGTTTVTTPLQGTLWIGKADSQLYQVKLQGAVTDGDSAASTRTFILSNFGESVTITAPTTH
jgi:hypothetical protein